MELPSRASDAGPTAGSLSDARDLIWSADEYLHDAAEDSSIDTMYRNLIAAHKAITDALVIVGREQIRRERSK